MLDINISKTDMAAIEKRMRNVSPQVQNNAIQQGVTLMTVHVEGALKRSVGGTYLKVRSGRLRNSIQSKIERVGTEIMATVGSGVRTGERVKYANILETGGVILPKNAKMLTIPLAAAKTAGGDSRGSARSFANTFISKGIIYQKQGDNIVPLFVLKDRVTIPAFRYLSKTVKDTRAKAIEILKDAIDRGLKAA